MGNTGFAFLRVVQCASPARDDRSQSLAHVHHLSVSHSESLDLRHALQKLLGVRVTSVVLGEAALSTR